MRYIMAFYSAALVAVFITFAMPVMAQPVGTASVDPNPGHVTIIQTAPAADAPVSVGSLGVQVITWLGAVFIPVIGGFLTKLIMTMIQKAGIQASQALSDKIDATIENGLHSGEDAVNHDLTAGNLTVDVKNQTIQKAVAYAQDHGADDIKALTGLDPNDPKVIASLQARATKVLSNIGSASPPAAQA